MYDDETGLYYLKSRYYSPALGRFLTRDSIRYTRKSDPQTLNRYSYCRNNPVSFIDPNGKSIIDVIVAVVKVVTTVAKQISNNNHHTAHASSVAIAPPISPSISLPSIGVGSLGSNIFGGFIGAIVSILIDAEPVANDDGTESVDVSKLKRLPKDKIDELGGEDYTGGTGGVKSKTGGPKSDLYWNPDTGDVFSVPKRGGGPPQFVDTINPR